MIASRLNTLTAIFLVVLSAPTHAIVDFIAKKTNPTQLDSTYFGKAIQTIGLNSSSIRINCADSSFLVNGSYDSKIMVIDSEWCNLQSNGFLYGDSLKLTYSGRTGDDIIISSQKFDDSIIINNASIDYIVFRHSQAEDNPLNTIGLIVIFGPLVLFSLIGSGIILVLS